ncbi:MAG: 2-isopropylmalate synthase, partial [Planctomycetaceae bacterium]|nr:2-isopropylmalate synthase [Planctomycetaceae bacterium]
GRHAFRDRVVSLGYELDDATFQKVFDDFIALADKKKEVYDADIVALIENRSQHIEQLWEIKKFSVVGGSGTIPTATIELQHIDDGLHIDAATGDGPVDAAFKCLERIVGIDAKLTQYNVRSVSGGKDAQGEVSLAIDVAGRNYHGKGVSTDVIEASVLAYLQALNKALSNTRGRESRSERGV